MNEEFARFIAAQQTRIHELESPVHNDRRPGTLACKSLSSLVTYLYENHDGVKPENCIIVIHSYDDVALYSPVHGASNNRHLIMSASPLTFSAITTDRMISQESFIIELLTRCVRTSSVEELVHLISGLTFCESATVDDDGVKSAYLQSEKVLCNNGNPPSIVSLQPYRIFPEVEQPTSQYLLRIGSRDKMPTVGLFEADGGLWRLQAMQNIKEYLEECTKDRPVTIIA